MVLEILGTRLIGPVYGTNLYVWSALIAVTLVSLSAGYWLGGRVSDRRPDPGLFFLLFELAALLIALVPLVRAPVFGLTRGLGLRGGALASAALFLAAPLVVLGMLSPFAVRLAARMVEQVGRTAGRLYAVSTAGSLVGTLLTGFVLIPEFRVRTLFFGAAAVLLLPAVIYQAAASRRGLGAAGVAGLALGWAAARPPATSSQVVEVRESAYSQIKVAQGGNFRALFLNGATQTIVDPATGRGLTTYPYLMADAAWRAAPQGRRALIVGLGGGLLPGLLETWGVRSTVLEIDPAMVEVAARDFGFDPRRARVAIGDGRRLLAADTARYDYILLDAFAGEQVPIHMLTSEMMEVVDRHLAPRGVVVLNYVGYRDGPEARPLRSVARTIAARFPWIRVLPCGTPGRFGGNVLVAGRAPVVPAEGPRPFRVPAFVDSQLAAARPLPLRGPGTLLTDDYNPLDLWSLAGHEEGRRESLAWLPWDVTLAE
ncbi:MAG TPA: fused MFS/spermidine synthase [Candidatus Saccharimonadales bacterium]|nr:fused MFS/spermidine synthase [Candidatus Saccharimonadales bacterium]